MAAAAKETFADANAAFVEEDYDKALRLYTEAIEVDDTRDDFYSARAQANIKLGLFKDAVSDASKAIERNSNNVKSFLRKGIAQYHLEDYINALATLKIGKSVDESDKNIATWIDKCETEVALLQKSSSSEQNLVPNESSPTQNTSDSSTKPETTDLPMPSGPKTRYDWYQTDSHVILTILVKNVKKEDLEVDLQEKSVSVSIKLPSGGEYSLHLELSHTVVPAQSQVKILGSKVEIKLKKAEGLRWAKLEGEDPLPNVKQFDVGPSADAASGANKYPSSSHYTRDWDKLVTEIKKEEKDEKPEGDAAVNQLFQQIYADGNDDVRRAMNKSFVESGGTVLSTNWGDIGKKKTEVKPPDGMEYKKYES